MSYALVMGNVVQEIISNSSTLTVGQQIIDAEEGDFISWGGATKQITGGVQQFWQEGNWAYYTPFSGIISTGGGIGLLSDLLLASSVLTDLRVGANFRFGLTESDQLLIQMGRGRAANDNVPEINQIAA